ncbi:MAG: ABC transporter substrate-binding protein, partial [Xanthobacteraceae bacterium]
MTIELDRRKMLQLLGVGAGSMPLIGHAPLAFAAGDTVTIGWPTDVPSWDPNQRFSPDVQPIFKLVFDQPVNQDPKLAFVPNLATKWELAPDALSMAVDLRDDVTFQNGDKLTADDLRYTFFERIKAGHKVDTANSWRKVIDIEVQSPTRAVMK